jgi:hypothetical protein
MAVAIKRFLNHVRRHAPELLVAPIPGREPEKDPVALTLDDFAMDERTGRVETCLERCESGNAERARR